jgi:hypothetical protein
MLEEERFHCQVEEIEVYESSSHEEKKSLFKTSTKMNIFSIFYGNKTANDETEEKEEHLQTFSPAK